MDICIECESKYCDTHACCLLYTLQQVFGGDEEVQQTLQCIAFITFLNGTKQLAQDYRCCGFKWWKKSREGTLDGRIQRFWVLEDKQRWRSRNDTILFIIIFLLKFKFDRPKLTPKYYYVNLK